MREEGAHVKAMHLFMKTEVCRIIFIQDCSMFLTLLEEAHEAQNFIAQSPPRLICAADVPPSWQFVHEKNCL